VSTSGATGTRALVLRAHEWRAPSVLAVSAVQPSDPKIPKEKASHAEVKRSAKLGRQARVTPSQSTPPAPDGLNQLAQPKYQKIDPEGDRFTHGQVDHPFDSLQFRHPILPSLQTPTNSHFSGLHHERQPRRSGRMPPDARWMITSTIKARQNIPHDSATIPTTPAMTTAPLTYAQFNF
jgi:hypothetical protein